VYAPELSVFVVKLSPVSLLERVRLAPAMLALDWSRIVPEIAPVVADCANVLIAVAPTSRNVRTNSMDLLNHFIQTSLTVWCHLAMASTLNVKRELLGTQKSNESPKSAKCKLNNHHRNRGKPDALLVAID
jgi:hypothetical protein